MCIKFKPIFYFLFVTCMSCDEAINVSQMVRIQCVSMNISKTRSNSGLTADYREKVARNVEFYNIFKNRRNRRELLLYSFINILDYLILILGIFNDVSSKKFLIKRKYSRKFKNDRTLLYLYTYMCTCIRIYVIL